jgi:hypothetical protein
MARPVGARHEHRARWLQGRTDGGAGLRAAVCERAVR